MDNPTIGIIIIVISALGYASNWLNWRFLNFWPTRLLYYLGAFIHETSHAIACFLTGARIYEYQVISSQPRVTHSHSKLPVLGDAIIAIAPLFGGSVFLYFINNKVLTETYQLPLINAWGSLPNGLTQLFWQINFNHWQTYILLFLFLNVGAMLGPSWQDLKNVWPVLLILCFIRWSAFSHIGLLAVALIMANIIIQIILIIIIGLMKKVFHKKNWS